MIAAAGKVYRIQLIVRLAPVVFSSRADFYVRVFAPRSKEKSDAAEKRVRKRAGEALVDHPLIGWLYHHFGRREDRRTRGVELALASPRRQIGGVAGGPTAAR